MNADLAELLRELTQADPEPVKTIHADERLDPAIEAKATAIADEGLTILGGGRARIIPFDAERDHGKSWNQWMAGQRGRIFAEAKAARATASNHAARDQPTAFQRAFFAQLAELQAATAAELVELARQRGIPRECAEAFWRQTPERDQQAPTRLKSEKSARRRASC
jgi:hypothetical protein